MADILGDRYEVLEKLTSGGLVGTFRGNDHKEKKPVLIKQIGFAFEPAEREYKLFSKLSHRNILQAYDRFNYQGSLWYVLEYVEGSRLLDALPKSEGGRLGEIPAYVFSQLQSVLDYLHNLGIVHGGLAPGNLVVTEEKLVKVIDLSSCYHIQGNGPEESLGSFPGYSSPEHFTGRLVPESDYFVVGTLILEYISGHNPFDKNDFREFIVSTMGTDPRQLVVQYSLDDSLSKAISSLLAMEPKERRHGWRLLHEITAPHLTLNQSLENKQILSLDESDNSFKTKDTTVASILFLAADPTDASRLRLGEEFREIHEKLKLAQLRDRFRLELPQLSVRPADISQALLDFKPQIVHFSGHGASSGALRFENQLGKTHLVDPDALAALFEQFAHQINCVLLNACYSETQAKAVAEYIKYVIGMNKAIGDKAAIAFAIGFYQALGAGRTVEEAYKLGCVQIRLQGISEYLTPVLIKKGQAQP